jgi:uncharacterized membrane protein
MERTDLDRVVAFTDAVMAVAITLLALEIDVPDLPSGREDELGHELFELLPSFLAYALAFALVGRYWVIHHRLFERVQAVDGTLMVLNLCFLALIVLMPFATELIDDYTKESSAAAVFGGLLGVAALVHTAMLHHVHRSQLLRPDAEEPARAVSIGLAVVFLVSVPVAFLSTLVAHLIWASAIVMRYPLRRLAR